MYRVAAGRQGFMHLVVEFARGESILTENSHKYLLSEVDGLAQTAGFSRDLQWIDPEWPFAETLLFAQ